MQVDFSSNCLFCNATDVLNTVISMSVDEVDYKIAIGDECEDDATPKNIKNALNKKIDEYLEEQKNKESKLDELKRVAAELGFELNPVNSQQSGLVIPQKTTQAQPVIQDLSDAPVVEHGGSKFVVQKNKRNQVSEDQLSAEEMKTSIEEAKRKSSASGFRPATSAEASRYSSYTIPESVSKKTGQEFERPKTLTKANQVVKGRLGLPTTIPKKLITTDGETTIEVVDTGGDKALRERMEMINMQRAHMESMGMGQPNDTLTACASCDGVGKIKSKVCVRCTGQGYVGLHNAKFGI